eukprot:TRINITY_DN9473_c0_g1_i4.p1 TRINITY_DN9473_c0_g1~~TRINITY_DN9473_c0_g1_i4.p1  ORF type:complete len:501 (-),score=99.67 TRINITY_DN9473_c0_g1_i4:534-1964(-)
MKPVKRGPSLREATGPTLAPAHVTTASADVFNYHGSDHHQHVLPHHGSAAKPLNRSVPASPIDNKHVRKHGQLEDNTEPPVPTYDMSAPLKHQGSFTAYTTDNDFALFDALDAHQVMASPLDEEFGAPTMAAAVKKAGRPKKGSGVRLANKASAENGSQSVAQLPQPLPTANSAGGPPAPPEPDYLIAQIWGHLLNDDSKAAAQGNTAPPQISMIRAGSAGSRMSTPGGLGGSSDAIKSLADVVVPTEPVKLRQPPPVGPKPSFFEVKTPGGGAFAHNPIPSPAQEAEPQVPEIDHDQPELEAYDPNAPANQTDDEDNPFIEKESSEKKKPDKRVEYDDEIDFNEIELKERIGLGGFAEVFKGEWRGTEVAVKKLLPNKQTKESIEEFKTEIDMMRKLRHPHIVLFMGASLKPPNVCIVTELLQMSLFDLLHNTKVKLTWKIRFKISIDTAIGMNFLHLSKPPIIHRDLVTPFLPP